MKLSESTRSDILDNIEQVLAETEHDDIECLKDTLYGLTAQAETAAGNANYLLHADVSELRDRVHDLEAELDVLAQALRDFYEEV